MSGGDPVAAGTADAATPGPVLFARYAYPPNALGYCGPDDPATLLTLGAMGEDFGRLRALARGFEGAWPYLELIAQANGVADPLDSRVVEAYWVGNGLLDRVTPQLLGAWLDERFRSPLSRPWRLPADAVPHGAVPHHSFQVFSVYPWLGLLRTGIVDEPLRVLDRCRIRWGRVEEVAGDLVAVTCDPLVWDGARLGFGPPASEWARAAVAGTGFVGELEPGAWVALHWDWVCDRLTGVQLDRLRARTDQQLDVANRTPASGPAHELT